MAPSMHVLFSGGPDQLAELAALQVDSVSWVDDGPGVAHSPLSRVFAKWNALRGT